MSVMIDNPGPVREGEELDVPALESYLEQTLGQLEGPIVVEQFHQGHSNLTYLLRVGEREWVLRRPPFGSKVKTAHNMGREFKVLSGLSEVYDPAPRPTVLCEDESVLGARFYLMERIKGVIVRTRRPDGVLLPPETVRQCCRSFIKNLSGLHNLDYEAIGLGDLHRPGQYVNRQVLGWAKRYEGSKTDGIPDMDSAEAWLKDRIPQDSDTVLVHNDYKWDNLVLAPDDLTRIIGVLDWEMCTIGDPLMDLGATLAYWLEPSDPNTLRSVQCFLTGLPGSMTRAELAEEYGRETGRDVSNILFYYVFGLVKVAVIVQQIYYRYARGLTKDERFAPMIHMVRALAKMAVTAGETGEV